jgi:2-amino-4-hydroxy-6-hydroxymethyldihydropteridine diphosphokinase
MPIAYIAFGSNLGDRNKNIQHALGLLNALQNVKIKKISSIIETEPEGGPKQGKFLNGAVKIETDLSARNLLEALQQIETGLGRKKTVKNGPRWRQRQFVVEPLREIAPGKI